MAQHVACGIRRVSFATKSEAEDYLSQIAECISDVKFACDEGEFKINYAGGSLGKCDLHRGAHGPVSFSVNSSDQVHFLILQKGDMTFSEKSTAMAASADNGLLLLPPRARGSVRSQSPVSGISLIISADALSTHATKILGEDRSDIKDRRPAVIDLSDPVAGTLARNIASVFHEMQRLGETGLSSIACANFDDLLLGMSAMAVSPTARLTFDRDPKPGGASIARRARDYLRSHATEPLRLSDLAMSLGVGLRTLQISFRREFGTSPREFLMSCRLELARSRLLDPDPGSKVSAVAIDCGFTDLALFSRKYRDAFGELPSETLRWRTYR